MYKTPTEGDAGISELQPATHALGTAVGNLHAQLTATFGNDRPF